MTGRSLRAAVIGLGVGERHVASYQAIDDVEVVAVCDVDPVRLAEVADRYQVPRRHLDHRKVTEDPDIDVISICSYDDAHVDQAVSALGHGKHVMVEKPIALRREEAARLAEAVERSGRILTSNLILRRSPRFRALKDWIDAGDLGDIFMIEGDYLHQILWKLTEGWRGRLDTYSVVFGGGVHLVDLMRWLLDDEVDEVTGMGNDLLSRRSPYRYEDTASHVLRFRGGAIGRTTTSLGPQRPKFHALSVYGTTATFVNGSPSAWLYRGDDPDNATEVTTPYPGMEKGDMLPGLVRAIREGGQPDVPTVDVFRTMDVCFAAVDAMRGRRVVKVSYLL